MKVRELNRRFQQRANYQHFDLFGAEVSIRINGLGCFINSDCRGRKDRGNRYNVLAYLYKLASWVI